MTRFFFIDFKVVVDFSSDIGGLNEICSYQNANNTHWIKSDFCSYQTSIKPLHIDLHLSIFSVLSLQN